MAAEGGKWEYFFSKQQPFASLHCPACHLLFNNISSCLLCELCEDSSVKWRGKIWQNHLIREGAAGCRMSGSGVILKHQCLPGKVVPHHCQLLSEKERGGWRMWTLLIIQLKTFALSVKQRKSYL